MRDLTGEFAQWLERGGRRVGEVLITRAPAQWELRHVDDADRADLSRCDGPHAARALAKLDERGAFRPLKTAPTLRRGWVMFLGTVSEVRDAIEDFYPAMIGVWSAQQHGELVPVPLRDTLNRQTGMYRVTARITDDEAQQTIAHTCHQGACLKTILWQIAPGQPVTSLPAEKFHAPGGAALPLLCQEACNILVANARKTVKGEPL